MNQFDSQFTRKDILIISLNPNKFDNILKNFSFCIEIVVYQYYEAGEKQIYSDFYYSDQNLGINSKAGEKSLKNAIHPFNKK